MIWFAVRIRLEELGRHPVLDFAALLALGIVWYVIVVLVESFVGPNVSE